MKINKSFLGKFFALALSFITLLCNTVSGTLSFITYNTGEVKNTFTPFDIATSNLIISKKVEHPLGDDYKIPDNISFDFKVELGAYYAGYTISTTKGGIKADQNGILSFSVKPNEAVSLQGIDEGTLVKITELQNRDGFSVKGEATKNVIISKDEFAKADFVNIYSPKKTSAEGITLKGVKNLTGRKWKNGDSFTFVLEQNKNDKWATLSEKTISYSSSADFNKFDFTDAISSLSFDKVGSYAFRIYEKEGSLAGIDYDKTINYFYINVTDTDMDGKLEISGITTKQNASVSEGANILVEFNNAYSIPKDMTICITANKIIKSSGSKTIGPENFSFLLEGNSKKLTAKSGKDGKAFFNLDFGYQDIGKTYKYKVSEINDLKKNVTYSTAVYDLAVTISLGDDNNLIAEIVVNGKAYTHTSIIFENIYESKLDTPITGDSSHDALRLAVLLFVLSSAAIIIPAFCKKRKQR